MHIKLLGVFCIVKNLRMDRNIGNLEPKFQFLMYKNPIVDFHIPSLHAWNKINSQIMKLQNGK